MYALLAFLSIIGIALIVQRINNFEYRSLRVCPLCTGVLVTWVWLLIVLYTGGRADPLIPAVLMGGSAVGIANAATKHMEQRRASVVRTILTLLGFILTYVMITRILPVGVLATIAAIYTI